MPKPKYVERGSLLQKAKLLQGNLFAVPLILDAIEYAPAVDVVEVTHGGWIEVQQTGRNSRHIKYTTKKCSVCGYWNGRRKTNYCPNCGAKMDQKEGAEECV